MRPLSDVRRAHPVEAAVAGGTEVAIVQYPVWSLGLRFYVGIADIVVFAPGQGHLHNAPGRSKEVRLTALPAAAPDMAPVPAPSCAHAFCQTRREHVEDAALLSAVFVIDDIDAGRTLEADVFNGARVSYGDALYLHLPLRTFPLQPCPCGRPFSKQGTADSPCSGRPGGARLQGSPLQQGGQQARFSRART